MKIIGNWWNDKNIQLAEVNGAVYALNGWNGEKYTDCWKCSGEFNMTASKESYELTPIYSEEDNENGGFDVVDYEVF
jgi:hypothetical protein